MKISILISSYNGKRDIPPLLESIQRLELDAHELEVIIRDDNSPDGTAEYISTNYPSVKVVAGTRNLGFVRSCNELVRTSSGDVICCVNQDTILGKRFLLEGLSILEKHSEAVGVNTNMIMPWIMGLEDFLNTPLEDFPVYEYRLTPYGFAQYVQVEPIVSETNFMTGGGFFLRRSALEENEPLFDPDLRMYCEDTELSLRIKKRGGMIMYSPRSVLFHNQEAKKIGTLGELKKVIRITWNRFYVMAKHNLPWSFVGHYPLFVWGIVKKMDYLGLPSRKMPLAYFAGACLAVSFLFLFPYWLMKSYLLPKTL